MKYWWYISSLLFLIIIQPSFAALVSSGNYFSGTSFNASGGTFTVIGVEPSTFYNNITDDVELHYKSILVRSNIDSTVQITNGTCRKTSMYAYCYTGWTIDMNNPKTFTGDYLQPLLGVTISTLDTPTASITINRDTNVESYCTQPVTIPLTISSSGTLITNVTYIEQLPQNTVVISTNGGDVKGNTLTFKDVFGNGMSKSYSYTLDNTDCQPKNWSGYYTYTTSNGTVINILQNFTLTSFEPYIIDEPGDIQTNNPDGLLTYNLSVSNLMQSAIIFIDADTSITPQVYISDISSNIQKIGDKYVYHGDLPGLYGDVFYINFRPKNYGEYTINTDAKLAIGNKISYHNSTIHVSVLKPEVLAYIDIDLNKSTNTSISAQLVLQNNDLKNMYYNAYGVYKDYNEEPLLYSNMTPGSTNILLERVYNLTGSGNLNVSFDGVYRDASGNEKKIHADRLLTSNTVVDILENISNNTASSVTLQKNITENVNVSSSSGIKSTNSTVHKDFITSIIEGINNLLQSLFSKN